ncbi:efflux RND transporter periplasmic adaptor subunit [Candidatus Latescibacterota bacterium]
MNNNTQPPDTTNHMSASFKTIMKNPRFLVAAGVIVIITIKLSFSMLSLGIVDDDLSWTRVIKDTFYVDIIESGEVRAVNSYNIQAPMEWRSELQITDMVKEGTFVEKGDFLAQFDTSSLVEDLDTAIDQLKAQEAELLSVQTKQASQMSQFETDLKMAEYSREASELQLELLKYESDVRKEEARLSHQIALISFDETETKIRTQKIMDGAEMGRVMQTLKYRRNYVDDLHKRIDNLTLTAPISGMVVYNEIGGWRGTPKHKIAIGETVWPRMTVILIPDLSEMESVIHVNEIDASKLVIGQEAFLTLDAFEDRIFNGRVITVAPLASKAQSEDETNIKDYEVVIRIDESAQIIKPGMSAKTRIILDEIPDAHYVHIGAVFEIDGEPVVFPKRTYPDYIPVTYANRNDRFIMIEGDISEKDEISLVPPVPEAKVLGWFAEMEKRLSEKETLLGHLNTMEENGITEKIAENAKKVPKEVPQQYKMLADMLEKAGYPLTEEQIEKLANFKPSPESPGGITEILTEEQKKAMKNSSEGAGNPPGGIEGQIIRRGSGGPRPGR